MLKAINFKYQRDAEKFFDKHEDVQEVFEANIRKIVKRDHPERVNIKPLKGKFKGYFRMAIGGYRVIYQVINGEIIVVDVAYAGSRGDVYKKFRR